MSLNGRVAVPPERFTGEQSFDLTNPSMSSDETERESRG